MSIYNSKYFTNEQIDQRLLQNYYDDAVTAGYTGTKKEFLESLVYTLNEHTPSEGIGMALYYSIDGGEVTFTITRRLTNCNSSSNTTSVSLNTPYTTTITAKAGYTLGLVTVTMDGTDITSSVYSNGIITIQNVTGDVIITATATADAQAGLFDNASWFNGFWSINTSDNTATPTTSTNYLGTYFFGVPSANFTIAAKSISGYLVGFRFYLCRSVNGTTASNVSKSSAYGKISGAVAESVNTDTIKSIDPSAQYFAISMWAKSSSGSGNLDLSNKTFNDLITVTRN